MVGTLLTVCVCAAIGAETAFFLVISSTVMPDLSPLTSGLLIPPVAAILAPSVLCTVCVRG